MNVSHHMTTI